MMKSKAPLWATILLVFGACFWGCSDDEGAEKSASIEILSIQPEQSYPGVNTTVTFEITPGEKTAAEDLTWVVDFGDGQSVSGAELSGSASHIYQDAGQYTVYVAALAGSRELARESTTATVLGPVDLALSATRGAPANVRVGDNLSISFSATNLEGGAVESAFEVTAYLANSATVGVEDIEDLTLLGSTTVSAAESDTPVIAEGETAALGFTAKVPEGTGAGDYYVVTWANPAGQFSDVDPTNNLNVSNNIIRVGNTAQLLPDLGVTDVLMLPDRAFPTLNQLNRAYTITNSGSIEAFDVVAKAWLSVGDNTLDPDSDVLLEETAPFNVSASGKKVFDIKSFVLDQEIVPPTGGQVEVYLIVEVGIQGDSPEVNLDNNIGVSATPTIVTDERVEGTDIAVSDFVVTPESTYLDGTLHVSMTLRNDGTVDAGSFFCGLYLADTPAVNTDLDPRLSNINISQLAAGAEQLIDRDITVPSLFNPGTYYIYIVCDPMGTLAEAYRSNNQAIFETPIHITDQADIDLYVDSLTVPDAAEAGDVVTLVATLCVSGSNATGATRGQLWRTAAAVPDFTKPALLDFDIPNINPGECIDLEIETAAECLNFEGRYRYGIKIDVDNRLPESDEDNNKASGDQAIRVTGAYCACVPDGYGNDDALNAYSLAPGASSQQLCRPDRCDFYAVDLEANDSLLVTTTFETERGALVTTLFDPTGVNQLDKSLTDGRQEVSTFLAPTDGAYVFSVCGAASTTQNLYDLDVTVLTPPAGVDVVPRGLKVPVRDSFSIGSELDISFRVYNLGQTDTPGSFDAQLLISPNPIIGDGDDITLDPATVSVDQVPAGSSRDISTTVTIPTSVADGDYYLGVNLILADANTDNNWVASKKVSIETLCYDPLEPNDSIAEAATLTPGSYSNLVACTAGHDYYKVCVPNGKKFSVRADFDASQGDIDMTLFDQQLTKVDNSADVGTDFEQVSLDYVHGDQCYFVKVHLTTLEQVLQVSYDLTVAVQDVDPELQCAGAFEPNDTLASASSLRAALQTSVALDRCPLADTDVYYIALDAGQQVSFRGILDPGAQAGTLRIQLYKPNAIAGPNQETAPGSPVAEISNFRAPTTGIYYVEVTISGSQRRATYRLEADGLGALGGVDLGARDLVIGPGSYLPLDEVRFGFTLENLGTDVATSASYKVYLGDSATHNPGSDVEIGSFSLSGPVAGGDSVNMTGRVNLPASGFSDGTAYLHVVVHSNAETDINPANNIATTAITLSTP